MCGSWDQLLSNDIIQGERWSELTARVAIVFDSPIARSGQVIMRDVQKCRRTDAGAWTICGCCLPSTINYIDQSGNRLAKTYPAGVVEFHWTESDHATGCDGRTALCDRLALLPQEG